MIKAKNVVFEYQKYDEEGNVSETKRAVDGVELDVKKGEFIETTPASYQAAV